MLTATDICNPVYLTSQWNVGDPTYVYTEGSNTGYTTDRHNQGTGLDNLQGKSTPFIDSVQAGSGPIWPVQAISPCGVKR